jgi:hypothetical protein
MGKLEKLIDEIMKLDKSLRFDELTKVLIKFGYTQNQPKGGSSHYTFRKSGKMPITIKKDFPMDVEYIKKIREALIEEGF